MKASYTNRFKIPDTITRPMGVAIIRIHFLVADTQLYQRLCPSVRPSVGRSVGEHKLKRVKTCISAHAHPSATGGRVSGHVSLCIPGLYRCEIITIGQLFLFTYSRWFEKMHKTIVLSKFLLHSSTLHDMIEWGVSDQGYGL